jgi:hypothetical protein
MADVRAEVSWATCTLRMHSTDGIDLTRVTDHDRSYTKPRPPRYWEWHCPVCNAPQTTEPK